MSIHMVVNESQNGTVVAFKDAAGILAELRGPRVLEALAWIMAAITDPYNTVIRKEKS